jgi:hypothetical protein
MRRDLKKVRDTKDRTVLKQNKTDLKSGVENGPKKKPAIVNEDEQKVTLEEVDDRKGEIYIEDSEVPGTEREKNEEDTEEKENTDEVEGKKLHKIVNTEEEIVNKKG